MAEHRRPKPGRYASRRPVRWVLLGVLAAALLAAFSAIRALVEAASALTNGPSITSSTAAS